ncbi:hypothetical protein LTR84_011281 [Exophiala bonariae]|uniref:Uncharacterized protein n=1 Tax=Exophiala bonariae TaxID=1690606 RepID=A0AAV9MSC2_9EURO|nr:hypothetical protein LTR84_011281 [Exophiala bonariae]
MKTAIISSGALAALAVAAPMTANNSSGSTGKKTTPSVYYVDGQRTDYANPGPAQVKSACTVDDDVYTCAQKTAAAWKVPTGYASSYVTVDIPATIHFNDSQYQPYQLDRSAVINLVYQTSLSNCHLSDPQIIDHQDLFDCNDSNGCKQTFTFSQTTTAMTSEGWHLGASLTAGFNVGFASASATITGDQMANWSNSTTLTTTTSREYDLAAGDVCAPTTIQFETQCQQVMKPSSGSYNSVRVTTTDPSGADLDIQLPLCTPGGNLVGVPTGYPSITSLIVDSNWQTIYSDFCQAMTQPTGLNVDVANFDGKATWAIQGCMAS